MKRFITDTTIIAVREHSPILATRKNADGSVETVYGPEQWHIVTAPPGPLCIVTDRKPDVKVGDLARIALEVLEGEE